MPPKNTPYTVTSTMQSELGDAYTKLTNNNELNEYLYQGSTTSTSGSTIKVPDSFIVPMTVGTSQTYRPTTAGWGIGTSAGSTPNINAYVEPLRTAAKVPEEFYSDEVVHFIMNKREHDRDVKKGCRLELFGKPVFPSEECLEGWIIACRADYSQITGTPLINLISGGRYVDPNP